MATKSLAPQNIIAHPNENFKAQTTLLQQVRRRSEAQGFEDQNHGRSAKGKIALFHSFFYVAMRRVGLMDGADEGRSYLNHENLTDRCHDARYESLIAMKGPTLGQGQPMDRLQLSLDETRITGNAVEWKMKAMVVHGTHAGDDGATSGEFLGQPLATNQRFQVQLLTLYRNLSLIPEVRNEEISPIDGRDDHVAVAIDWPRPSLNHATEKVVKIVKLFNGDETFTHIDGMTPHKGQNFEAAATTFGIHSCEMGKKWQA